MYCSICGASVPEGRGSCDTCGNPVHRYEPVRYRRDAAEVADGQLRVSLSALRTCPRCDYQGQGLPYFSRGPHMAGLIAVSLLTLPWALGAGGVIYYVSRRDHRVCPRCGAGWGRRGEAAVDRPPRAQAANRPTAPISNGDGIKRAWSVILFSLGILMLAVGIVELEAIVLVMGVLAATGGVVLHRAANAAREERRAALISAMQQPVLKLAAEHDGRLTVTQVAAALDWTLSRAEKVLHSLDDGWRVSSEVTGDGVIVYEFREILLAPRPDRHVDPAEQPKELPSPEDEGPGEDIV